MRDHATIEQLLVLANLESLNAELERSGDSQPKAARRANEVRQLIHMALPGGERLTKLNAIAIRQMRTLTASAARLLEN
jgi:hypothetical protein